MTKINFGSVSHGTLRNQDLIPSFLDLLYWHEHHWAEEREDEIPQEAQDNEMHVWWDSEEASELAYRLIEDLQDVAPAYSYFGSHPGDGSDFGFWPDWQRIELAIKDAEIFSVDELNSGESWCCYKCKVFTIKDHNLTFVGNFECVIEVNDHGNATLWSAYNGEEIWSVV